MTFDEFQDEYLETVKDILDITGGCHTDDDGIKVFNHMINSLKLRYKVLRDLRDELSDMCEEHQETILDKLFPLDEELEDEG